MQARPMSKSKRLGYASTQNTLKTFALVRDDILTTGQKLDANVLASHGIPKGDTFPVMGTLRHLQLVDNQDRITETFSTLAHTPGNEYRELLLVTLNYAYGDLIHRLDDPAKATRQQVVDILKSRRYELPKQYGKMAGLFIGLYREASLGLEDHETSQDLDGQEVSPEPSNDSPVSKVLETTAEITLMPETTEVPNLNGLTHAHQKYPLLKRQVDVLQLLLQMPESAEWTGREQEWWKENFRMNVNMLLKLVEGKDQEMKS